MKQYPVLRGIVPCMMPEGRCLAGFSGGADSTAMMLLLAEYRDRGVLSPEAVHVNHGLRGRESDGDESFCRTFCESLHIPLHVVRVDLNGKADENSCREARFAAFRKIMDSDGFLHLVLAHNRDDLAETFLMRLMRGAGPKGLSCMGMKDEHDGYTVWRPLLRTGRDEIRNALREIRITWREDSTNDSDDYFRNRVRRQLIPLMNTMCDGIQEKIARTAGIISEENSILQQEADMILEHSAGEMMIRTDELRDVPTALIRRVMRSWWSSSSPTLREHSLNAKQTEELTALVSAERGKINLPGELYAVKGRNGIYLTEKEKHALPEIPYNSGDIRIGQITLRTVPSEGNPGNGTSSQEIPGYFAEGCTVRSRRPGDFIRPFGMKGRKKFSDYLQDRGIDEPWRDRIPILCRGSEVLLAAGVGAGAVPEWKKGASNIRLIWTGDLPWMNIRKEGLKNGSEQSAVRGP